MVTIVNNTVLHLKVAQEIEKNSWRNKGQSFSKFDGTYKPIDTKKSMNCKHNKHVENYIKTHCNQVAEK